MLEQIHAAYKAERSGSARFGLRGAISNDVIDMYWQLLRSYGYQDSVEGDTVVIDSCSSDKALKWLRSMVNDGAPKDSQLYGISEISDGIVGDNPGLSMAIAWPYWLSPAGSRANGRITVKELSPNPVLGLWLLGIATSSKHADKAAELILRVTTDPNFQTTMAKDGSIPVLKTFTDEAELEKEEFWHKSYRRIREALKAARPRPRTPQWWQVEQALGPEVSAAVFEGGGWGLRDHLPFYRFRGSCR